MNFRQLKGARFGRLTVIERCGYVGSFVQWLCRCECGDTHKASSRSLIASKVKSCGCFRRDFTTAKNTIHGMIKAPEFRIWATMRQRCSNPNSKKYKNYGARGIRVCKRWNYFPNFLKDMGAKPSPKHSIERIDNDGNYCPQNCRWATALEQGINKTNNVFLTAGGETRCISEWSRLLGISSGMIRHRIRRGWSHEDALSKPARITK